MGSRMLAETCTDRAGKEKELAASRSAILQTKVTPECLYSRSTVKLKMCWLFMRGGEGCSQPTVPSQSEVYCNTVGKCPHYCQVQNCHLVSLHGTATSIFYLSSLQRVLELPAQDLFVISFRQRVKEMLC